MPLVGGSRLVLQTDAASTHLFNGPDTDSINLVFVKSGNFVPAHPSYGQTFDQFCGVKIVQSGKPSLPTLTLERVIIDKELLEQAAKAAGYEYTQWAPLLHPKVNWGVCTIDGLWNPLTDDGDALRLAVKLGLALVVGNIDDVIAVQSEQLPDVITAELTDDHYAATRRAIVRAAAEIGKATV